MADTSVYGSKVMKTPNLQRLADAGLTFDRFYVGSSTCAPSRAVAATGLYSIRNGCESNHGTTEQGIKTLPEYLSDLGCSVITFGKWLTGQVPNPKGYTLQGPNRPQNVTKFLQSWSGDKPLCICYGTHNPHSPWAGDERYRPEQVEIPPGVLDIS